MSKYGIQSYRVRSPRELCRVTLYPNPMAVGLPWTWQRWPFVAVFSAAAPQAPSFCAHHDISVLLIFIHAVPAAWNTCTPPSSWPGEASESFTIQTTSHAITQQICTDLPGPRHRGTENRLSPFSSWNYCHTCVKHHFQVPASAFFPQAWVCMCLCTHMFTRDCMCAYTCVYIYSHVCIHTCTHTFYSTDVHWILLIGEFFSFIKPSSLHSGITPHYSIL